MCCVFLGLQSSCLGRLRLSCVLRCGAVRSLCVASRVLSSAPLCAAVRRVGQWEGRARARRGTHGRNGDDRKEEGTQQKAPDDSSRTTEAQDERVDPTDESAHHCSPPMHACVRVRASVRPPVRVRCLCVSAMSSHDDRVNTADGSTCSRRVSACVDWACGSATCAACCAGVGACCTRITPKTSSGSKKCAICSSIVLLLAIGLIIQAVLIPQALHNEVTHSTRPASTHNGTDKHASTVRRYRWMQSRQTVQGGRSYAHCAIRRHASRSMPHHPPAATRAGPQQQWRHRRSRRDDVCARNRA